MPMRPRDCTDDRAAAMMALSNPMADAQSSSVPMDQYVSDH